VYSESNKFYFLVFSYFWFFIKNYLNLARKKKSFWWRNLAFLELLDIFRSWCIGGNNIKEKRRNFYRFWIIFCFRTFSRGRNFFYLTKIYNIWMEGNKIKKIENGYFIRKWDKSYWEMGEIKWDNISLLWNILYFEFFYFSIWIRIYWIIFWIIFSKFHWIDKVNIFGKLRKLIKKWEFSFSCLNFKFGFFYLFYMASLNGRNK
jgi:hypothetical protein